MLCLYVYGILFKHAIIVGLYMHFVNFAICLVCSVGEIRCNFKN